MNNFIAQRTRSKDLLEKKTIQAKKEPTEKKRVVKQIKKRK